jgi:hypothetical protein
MLRFKSHRRDSTHDHFALEHKLEDQVNSGMLRFLGLIADDNTNPYNKF